MPNPATSFIIEKGDRKKSKMNKIVIAVVAGVILVLIMLALPFNVGAAGLGVGPPQIEITDALRGEECQEWIFVFNYDENSGVFPLGATGDISDWVSFYEQSDATTPVESITIPGNGQASVLVKFTIPADAPIGTASGTLYAETTPAEEASAGGQTVSLQVPISVTIEVVSTEAQTGSDSQGSGSQNSVPQGLIIGGIAAVVVLAMGGTGLFAYKRGQASNRRRQSSSRRK